MKILIIRLSSLGDIVLTQPVVKILRQVYPNAKIDFLTKKQFVDLVQAFGDADNILVWENEIRRDFKNLLKLRKNYDIVIDLHSKLNTFIIKKILQAPKTVTYQKKHLLRLAIIKKITKKKIDSTVELYFSALAKLGIKTELIFPELFVREKYDFKLGNSKKILIFPGALHRTKMYPPEQFSRFIDSVPAKWNCKFIVAGSENEKEICDKLVSLTKSEIINLCGKLSVSELLAVINSADVVISNDSGPMHIAAALKKPQIAIFGATHPALGFAPLNQKAVVLAANIPCQPCSLHGTEKCPKQHFKCMKMISPDMLKKNLNILLQNNF